MDYWIRDKKGFKTQVTNVKSITYVDVTMFDLGNYRDDPQGLINTPVTGAAVTNPATHALSETYIGSSTLVAAGVSDVVSHTAPRNESKKWTQIRFWSGKAGTASCTTATSTTLIVPSSYYLVAGQGVSGTGIVAGTLISSVTDANHVVLSQAATDSATKTLTFDDGELLHFIWATEFRQASNNTFVRI